MTLNGANTYGGTTTIAAGTLRLGDHGSLPSTARISLANVAGAALDLNGRSQVVAALDGGGADGGSILLGAGTLAAKGGDFAGNDQRRWGIEHDRHRHTDSLGREHLPGPTVIYPGTLRLAGGDNRLPTTTAVTVEGSWDLGGHNQTIASLYGWGTVTLGSGTLTVGDSDPKQFMGVIEGDGNLVKQGSGQWTLGGANTYTGSTTVNGGTLLLSEAANHLPVTTALTLADAAGASVVFLNSDQTIASLSGGGSHGGEVGIYGSRTLTIGDANDTTFAGILSGNGAKLVKQGSGTLTLLGKNTFSGSLTIDGGTLVLGGTNTTFGATTINAGTLRLSGGNDGLPTSTAVTMTDGVLDLNGRNQTLGSLIGANSHASVALGCGTLTVGNTSSTTFAGTISGEGGSLVKQGDGTLTLLGDNTFSGSLTVNHGTLVLEGTHLYGGPTTINGGTLRLSGDGCLPTATAVTMTGVTLHDGVLDLNSRNQTLASLSSANNRTRLILGSGTLTVGDANDTTFAGEISGEGGSLIKRGSGRWPSTVAAIRAVSH